MCPTYLAGYAARVGRQDRRLTLQVTPRYSKTLHVAPIRFAQLGLAPHHSKTLLVAPSHPSHTGSFRTHWCRDHEFWAWFACFPLAAAPRVFDTHSLAAVSCCVVFICAAFTISTVFAPPYTVWYRLVPSCTALYHVQGLVCWYKVVQLEDSTCCYVLLRFRLCQYILVCTKKPMLLVKYGSFWDNTRHSRSRL